MKVLFVTTISNTINAFLIPHIRALIDQGHQVDVACNIDQEVRPEIAKMGCKVYIIEFQRDPFNMDNYRAYKRLKNLIQIGQYELVHTHTPVASACVRLACRNMKNVRVLYTAHGFHFFKGASLKNWLIYYPVELFLARFTDVLITINEEDYRRAKKFKAKHVIFVPGIGVDTNKFCQSNVDKSKKLEELNIPASTVILLSVGEMIKRKNHETAIKAFARLDRQNVLYLICGNGELKGYLEDLVKSMEIEDKVRFLGFRNDILEICLISDIFVFPSYQEGLPVSIMEAMSAGLPIVCSSIRGNIDLIDDSKGGYLVKPNDIEGFAQCIQRLLEDKLLREKMGITNFETVKKFDIENVIRIMKSIYLELLD